MDDQPQQFSSLESHLFNVRLWHERMADGRLEWRGRVQHVLSGERRYFRDAHSLVVFLETYGIQLPDAC